MKKEIRILGIDDAPFDKFRDKECLVVGVLIRANGRLDGVLSTRVKVDGKDATEKIMKMIMNSRQYGQLKLVMIDGISLAGFNVVNIKKLNEKIKTPVIVVTRKRPNLRKIKNALMKLKDGKEKWEIIENLPKPKKFGDIYCQFVGIEEREVEEVLKMTTIYSKIPEPIRLAHIIGSGIIKGDSRGRP